MSGSDINKKDALVRQIKEQVKASEEARFLHRLHCVQLVSAGQSIGTVSECFSDDPSTIARWVRQFREFGVEGLHDDKKTGRPASLSIEQLKNLTKEVGQSPVTCGYYGHTDWNGKLLAIHLETAYSIALGVRQCQRLLRDLRNKDA